MKKIITTLFAIALSFGAFAQQQRDTMFVHKGQTIFHSATAEIDSIIFVRTGVSVPLGSTVTIRDTVEITVRDTVEVVVRDTTFIADTTAIRKLQDSISRLHDTISYLSQLMFPVTGITLDQTSATIPMGDNITLTATVLPQNAYNRNVIWTSSDTDIATVENGVVVAISIGTATITATTEDGNFTATATITVRHPMRGCNFNTPGWGTNLGTISWGTVGNTNIESGTTTIVSANGKPGQIWSGAVSATACNKSIFNGGNSATLDFNADCRSNPNFPGDFFSWCAVVRFAEQLCPAPWRVPTREDFVNLDILLGGTGYLSWDVDFVYANYIIRWGGAFGGMSRYNGAVIPSVFSGFQSGQYWSQSESSLFVQSAYSLYFRSEGELIPTQRPAKNWGLTLRCVRDVE